LAQDSRQRASFARKGLRARGGRDATLRAMLLRQLYLAFMEERRFDRALKVAKEIVVLDVMPDVARQDAARACLGLDAVEEAVGHLRIACRVCPASRRAFHSWTLGSVYYLAERYYEAMSAFRRAAIWGTSDKPLYRAQLALAKLAAGQNVDDLEGLRDALDDAPCGQGYGKFVLGELAYCLGDLDEAHACLGSFVRRTASGRVALQVALERELQKARTLLGRLDEARLKRA
jgi:tetratricopeptide (TPR) repeat protein